jgi:competence protein ComEC
MGARFALAAALACWSGIALAGPWGAPTALACAAVALALLALPRAGAGRLAAALLLLGLARGGALEARALAEVPRLPPEPPPGRIVGVVDGPPLRGGDAPVAVVRVLAAAPRLARGARVRLRLPAGCMAEWADTLHALVRFSPAGPPRAPGGRDPLRSERAAGLAASGRVAATSVRPARGAGSAIPRLAMRLRRGAEAALTRGLSPGARELATPLLLGDRSGMEAETDAALRASGLVHLLALSGLHVGWLATAVRTVIAAAGGGVAARAAWGALAALGFALVAGPVPSLARAVASEALSALGAWRERALDPLQALGVAALALLALAPQWAFDLGFQLSCAATFGLVAVGGPLCGRLARWPRAARAPARALAVSAGAQLAVLPWLLAHFHALPWTSLVANLAAVPVAEALLAAAALAALAEGLLAGAGGVWLAACEPLAAALHASVERFGGWPGALLATGSAPWLAPASALAVLALARALDAPRALDERAPDVHAARRAGLVAALLLGATLLGTSLARPLLPAPGRWWLVVLDVGQGDALAVATRDGWWLVDAGPRSPRWDAGERVVLPFLRWAGVRSLAAVVVTHDDGDHSGGVRALRRGIGVRAWLGPAPLEGVEGPCGRLGLAPLARGDTLALGPGARVAWPPRGDDADVALARRGDNSCSLVLELGEGGGRALLVADADSLVEARLRVREAPALLKAGHHGSGSSSGAAWLARLRPVHAAVSCGARNPHGHPDPGALARLGAAGATTARTDREGTLWYELSRDGARRLDWRSDEPRRAGRRGTGAAGRASASRAH